MTRIKDLSVNPFEFIRQCKESHLFITDQGIIEQSWMHGSEFAGRVAYLISKVNHADWVNLQSQRTMVKELATEMLGLVLYTQEQFAGKLIALVTEFGVGAAFIEEDRNFIDPKIVDSYIVRYYTPEMWNARHEFQTKEDAEAFAVNINSYGDFTL